MEADGSDRREVGDGIDNRQSAPHWSPDGKSLFFTVQERGRVHLYRLPVGGGGAPQVVIGGGGSVGSWSVGKDRTLTYAFATPTSPGELYLHQGSGTGGQGLWVRGQGRIAS